MTRKIFCLLAIPAVCFIIPYWVHLKIVNKTGPGDDYMTSQFQSSLEGNKITNSALPVFFGSKVMLKSKVEGMFLHSHALRTFFKLNLDLLMLNNQLLLLLLSKIPNTVQVARNLTLVQKLLISIYFPKDTSKMPLLLPLLIPAAKALGNFPLKDLLLQGQKICSWKFLKMLLLNKFNRQLLTI